MKTTLSLAVAVVLSLAMASNAAACITFQTAFNPTFKGDPNSDINDYGRIHHDADDPNCAQAAMYSLTDKLNQNLDASSTTFQQWLDGYLVAEIYASAMRIGANGWASQGLDDQLVELKGRFLPAVTEPSGTCGGDNFNTCMDDHVGNASAYAWMAAYMKRRPNRFTQSDVDTTIGLAEGYLRQALKPVSAAEPKNGICLRDTPVTSNGYTNLCTGTLAELSAGTAETFTVNGQQQLLHYGFGLMTNVASAKLGLELAGSTFTFSSDQKLVAKALMQEVQRHYNSSTHGYNADCIKRNVDQFGNVTYPSVDCGGGYLPDMYALRGFYDSRLDGVPAGTYDSNSFNASLFHLEDQYGYMPDGVTTVDTQHFSYGRFETYGIEGYAWWVSNPPRTWMPYDTYNPSGWVDGITSSGVIHGWACDRDMFDGRIFIDLYADNGATYVATATADQYSGTAYDTQCGGGTAHSFALQLPSSSHGKVLRAWALDFTWNGATEIGCSQSPTCSW
ncbi:MAG: hypothetical protein JWO56_3 [Acidobacteria bacterium]|nr:hypothetical protein [Acidobacteriota bacterium]